MTSMEISNVSYSHASSPTTPREVDPLLVLDVGGQIFKCHRSTLLHSGSSYFQQRFSGNFDDLSRAAYTDTNGLEVHFVERSGTLFEYVFRYIVSLHELNLPDFHTNPVLWRNLRAEALYFGLESLSELLRVTYRVAPNTGHQGVLYWLGTRRGTTDYNNPFSMGACYVGGWVDDSVNQEEYLFGLAGGQYSRKSFVQYRAAPKNLDFSEHFASDQMMTVPIGSSCRLLDCDHGGKRLPAVLDFKAIRVRPTHFSLRASLCLGMDGDWNLEASEGDCNIEEGDVNGDDVVWDVLHSSRNEDELRLRGERANGKAAMRYVQRVFLDELEEQEHKINNKEAMDVLVSYLEREQRHTWAIENIDGDRFYRYFRIIGADEIGVGGCLHAEGLEIFGEVSEA